MTTNQRALDYWMAVYDACSANMSVYMDDDGDFRVAQANVYGDHCVCVTPSPQWSDYAPDAPDAYEDAEAFALMCDECFPDYPIPTPGQ